MSRPPTGAAEPRILPAGDTALCVDFGNVIDLGVNARVMALDAAVRALDIPSVIETVPTYRSLLVHFDPCAVDHDALIRTLRERSYSPASEETAPRRWEVPVVYDAAFGEDLPAVAAYAGFSQEAFVDAHAAGLYRVYMIGFMPGFSYLGGMDPRLAMPRREQPRPRVPPSSISIGGNQTAIGSLESPSGWHMIGRTPVRPFMPGREPEFLFSPGDQIVFHPVEPTAWTGLDAAAAAGDPVARVVV